MQSPFIGSFTLDLLEAIQNAEPDQQALRPRRWDEESLGIASNVVLRMLAYQQALKEGIFPEGTLPVDPVTRESTIGALGYLIHSELLRIVGASENIALAVCSDGHIVRNRKKARLSG